MLKNAETAGQSQYKKQSEDFSKVKANTSFTRPASTASVASSSASGADKNDEDTSSVAERIKAAGRTNSPQSDYSGSNVLYRAASLMTGKQVEQRDRNVRRDYDIKSNWDKWLQLAQKDTLDANERAEAKRGAALLSERSAALRGQTTTRNPFKYIASAFENEKDPNAVSSADRQKANSYHEIAKVLNAKSSDKTAFASGVASAIAPWADKAMKADVSAINKAGYGKSTGLDEDSQTAINNFYSNENAMIAAGNKKAAMAGGIVGGVAGAAAGIGVADTALGGLKWYANLSKPLQAAVSSGAYFGAQGGASAASQVPSEEEWNTYQAQQQEIASEMGGSYTPQPYDPAALWGNVAKQAGIGAASGAAFGYASAALGDIGKAVLAKHGLQTPFMEAVRNVTAATGGAAASEGVNYAMQSDGQKPTKDEIVQNVATAFLLSALTSGVDAIQTTRANKAAIDYSVQEMQNEYARTFSGTSTRVERAAALDHVTEYNDTIRKAISQHYYAGNQPYIDDVLQTLDAIDEQVSRIRASGVADTSVKLPEYRAPAETAATPAVPASVMTAPAAQSSTTPFPVVRPQTNYIQNGVLQEVNRSNVERMAATLSEHGQKAMQTVYDGGDATAYSGDFIRAYNAGAKGADFGSVQTSVLTPQQKFAAFSAGQNDAPAAQGPATAERADSQNTVNSVIDTGENRFSAQDTSKIENVTPVTLENAPLQADNASTSKNTLKHAKDSDTIGTGNAAGSSSAQLAEKIQSMIETRKPFNSAWLFEQSDRVFGGTQAQGAYTPKDAYDAMELAVNKYLLHAAKEDMNGSAKTAHGALERLQSLLDALPTQTKRTDEQISYQQFSTPPTIAYLAAWSAGITPKDTVLEPSAGIGGIATFPKAWGATVDVNELSERRLSVLNEMGFDGVYNVNAEQLNNMLPDSVQPSVVLMNPPFSSTAGRTTTNKTSNAERHIEQALLRLDDGGRLVAILGKGMADDAPAFSGWWNSLRKNYSIRANVGIDGSNYKKYGTSWGVQLVVIDKTGPQAGETVTGSYKDLTEIPNVMEGIRNDRGTVEAGTVVRSTSGTVGNSGPQQPDVGGTRNRAAGGTERAGGKIAVSEPADSVLGDHGRGPAERPAGNQHGIQGGGELENGQRVGEGNVPAPSDVSREPSGSAEQPDRPEPQPARPGKVKKAESDDGVYAEYAAPELPIKGAKKHPAHLAESAAMAAVGMPQATYKPKLPQELISSGALSDAQLTNIVYAGQAHEQTLPDGTRKGYFIGDGTGVGKGRQIAGIILDNMVQGRKKAVWISKSSNLHPDAQRDWADIGGNKDDVFSFSKTKLGEKITQDSGILFSSYDTLATEKADKNRLQQIVDWLGKDFDGVIAFDEAHNMGNLLGKQGSRGKTKPAAKALAGAKLQEMLPNARVVYVSATAATDVNELAFAQRLGLWGKGTQFHDVNDFVSKISSGGLAAMELVARDMKSLGVYQARSISFNGVKYDTLMHNLTPMQTQIYNTMCQAWQVTLQNINAALEITGAQNNGKARSWALSAYYSSMQRFYNQILTSMSMPSVIACMKKELAAGYSCVLQIVNTNQAESDRQLAKAKEEGTELEDLDLTPKGSLLEYLKNSFPVYAYEEYTDDKGNKQSRPVQDKDGNPVIDKQAVAMRDALISQVEEMSVPEGPLEMLFDAFGPEQVAEVTGRSRRIVPREDENGKVRLVEEKRTPKHVEADVQAFQDGKKHILIFSDAGGTGKSYHADRRAKNQEQRIHYLIQAGWSAPKAVQGFGRTHRSNEVSAPVYKLVTTNIKGQKRFISTIARRLDQLGALTKGQRQTGSGMFGEKDNLESDLARDSLRNFYDRLGHNRIDGVDGMDILRKLGLDKKFTDEYGAFKLDDTLSRDMNTFLNRILTLEVDEQNAVFDEFNTIFDTAYDDALKNGTLDLGLENVKADKIEIIDDTPILTDENSGATTDYVQAKTYKKPELLTTIDQLQEWRGGASLQGLYRTDRGDVRAAFRIADKTDSRGNIVKQFRLQGPVKSQFSTWTEKTLAEHGTALKKSEWSAAWDKEVAKAPEYEENTVHMLTGTLLPVWNRLPQDHTRVMRIVADDGSQYLGRVIPANQIDDVLARFGGKGRTKETYTPADLMSRILKNGQTVQLTNDRIFLSRRRVSNEYRIEIKGQNLWYLPQNYAGIITETINYDRRYFIPTGETGERILGQIIKDNPVSSVSEEQDDVDQLIVTDPNSQSVGSGDTSINSAKLPAVFSAVKDWTPGTVNLDLGGGKFDNATEYLKTLGVTNYVFDKYNRSPEENKRAAAATQEGRSDTVTVSNVLNVIREQSGRDEVLRNALDAVKPDGTVYITIYEGVSKDRGVGKYTKFETEVQRDGNKKKVPTCWQENRLTSSYIPEVRAFFGDVTVKNKVIIARQPKKAKLTPADSIDHLLSDTATGRWSAPRNSNATAEKPMPISDIIGKARHDFGLPITAGHIRGKKDLGLYFRNSDSIRTKIANDLPTVAHELGHHLDRVYGMTEYAAKDQITELTGGLSDAMRDGYPEKKWKTEGFAEFLRQYLQSIDETAKKYPKFTLYFLETLSPEDARNITELADEVNAYYALDKDSAQSAIRFREEQGMDFRTPSEKAADKADHLYQAWIDSNHGIKRFDRAAGTNAYMLATNASYAENIAAAVLEGDLTDQNGQRVGDGLRTVLKDIDLKNDDEYRTFGEYLVVKHAPERIKEGMRIFADDRKNSADWCAARQAILEHQYPMFKETSEKLYEFESKFLQTWGVDTGLVSQESTEKWAERWQYYVPLNRDVGSKKTIGARRGFADQNSTIRQAYGSGLDIIHPVDNIMNNMVKMINAGIRNNVMCEITTAATRHEGLGIFLEQVERPLQMQTFNMAGIKEDLKQGIENSGLTQGDKDETQGIIGDLDDILVQYKTGHKAGNVITVLVDGKPQYWKINDPLLMASISNMSPQRLPAFLETLAEVNRFMVSNITGSNVLWSIFSNFPRDFATAMTFSEDKNPLHMLGGMGAAYVNMCKGNSADPLFKEYKAMGGTHASVYTADKDFTAQVRKKIRGDDKLKWLNPLDDLEFVSDMIETGPRFSYYRILRNKGYSPKEAFYASMDLTTNFRRSGTQSRQANKIIPFFNAGVQGLDRFYRWATGEDTVLRAQTAGERAKTARGRMIAFFLASAGIAALLHAVNSKTDEDRKNYAQLSNYTKNSYFCIPIGGGKYFCIPKPRELAVLTSAIEATLERTLSGDEHAFDEFYSYTNEQLLPNVLSDLAHADLAGAVGSLGVLGTEAYLMANRDFLGKPIVSDSMQALEPKDQYTQRTSKLAYWIGQAFNISPLRVDFFCNNILGGWWKSQKALFPIGGEDRDLTLGVQSQYIKDNQYSTDVINRLYDANTEASREAKSNPDDMGAKIAAKWTSLMTGFYSNYNKLSKDVSDTTEHRTTRQTVLNMIIEFQKSYDSGSKTNAQKAVESVCAATGSTEDYMPQVMQNSVKDGDGGAHTLTDSMYVDYQTDYLKRYYEYVESTVSTSDDTETQAKACKLAREYAKEGATNKVLKQLNVTTTKMPKSAQLEDQGVDENAQLQYQIVLKKYDADQNGSIKQEEAENALDSLDLTNEQKSALWQSTNKGWKEKNNPYS